MTRFPNPSAAFCGNQRKIHHGGTEGTEKKRRIARFTQHFWVAFIASSSCFPVRQ
jgi:hypothetical protein